MRGSLSCASPFIDEGSSEDVPEAPAQPAQPRPLASLIHGGFSGDPSLFAELGIIDADIQKNLRVVLLSPRDAQPLEESFVAGSLFFCAFAFALLLVGKRRFDAVYTIGFVGCLALSVVFRSITDPNGGQIRAMELFTVLSSALLPLIPAVLLIGGMRLRGIWVAAVAAPFIAWAAMGATRGVMARLLSPDLSVLVFVPAFLFYACLVLLPIY